MQVLPLPMRVQPAAIEVVTLTVLPFARGEVEIRPIPGRLVRVDAPPANPLDQQTARTESVVANEFRVESPRRLPGEPAIERVGFAEARRLARRLSIRIGRDDQLDDVLDVPAAVNEFGCEPVEQFGMRRPVALRSEIIDSPRQAGSEELLPQTIDEHAGRQRILARRQPPREIGACETTARFQL